MTTYIIEMMTEDNYCKAMSGCNNYEVETIHVCANTPEEARTIAMNAHPNMRINTYVQSVEEKAAEKARIDAMIKADDEKKAKAKARRIEREKENAKAAGLTIEEYRAKKNNERAIKVAEKEIARLEAELAEAKARLQRLKERA